MKWFLLPVMLLLFLPVAAQDKKAGIDAVVSAFPDAMAIWLEKKLNINLSWDKGKIKVDQQEYEDLLFTKDESANIAGKNSIYYSYFYNLKDWQAYTLLPDGKKIKVTNSTTHSNSRSFVFFDDSKEIEFLYPAASKGARGITQSNYELTEPALLTPFYFENYFPVASGQLSITYPEEIQLNYLIKGNNKETVTVKKETRRGKTTLNFEVKNVPGVNLYGDAPRGSYFLTHVIFYIEKSKDAQGQMQPFMGSIKDLARYCYTHIKDLNVQAGAEVKEVTDSIVKGITDAETKAKQIYKFVQQSVRYIAFEEGMGGFVPRDPELVCNRRYGDCKDKSALLVTMLRYAGLQAYFTWIGSRELPYDYSEIALPIVDDHMICTLELNGRTIFMDATDSYIPFDVPASHIQGKEALILKDKDDYKIVRVPVKDAAYSLVTDTSFIRLENKKVKGKIVIHTTGYQTNDLMQRLEPRTGKAREEYLQAYCSRGNNKVVISNIKLAIDTAQSKGTITAEFELPDYAKYLGNEVYLNMNLTKPYLNQEIDYPKRKIPVEFDFKSIMRHVVILEAAEGYKISSAPVVKDFANDVWGVSMKYEQKGNTLYYTREFKNDHLYLQPVSFEKWNKVLEYLFPGYKQSVVLSK